ncbi:hypothetical protein [Sporosarcina sp. USHLN248]|uniref:helix-turn-helix transcriptional regulator n=1 Tax=Sporosarcina sp. USHLN248 TaxID=3081300 RepID=UPI003017714F
MDKVRGVEALSEYLKKNNCPMSKSTIYRLLRKNQIPCRRPTPNILIFDLKAIDRWLSSDYEDEPQKGLRLVEREVAR